MKARDSVRRQRIVAARLLPCVILAIAAIGVSVSVSEACGYFNHRIVAARVAEHHSSPAFPGLGQLLRDYKGVVKWGAVWPDWGYAVATVTGQGEYADWGNVADTDEFMTALTAGMVTRFRRLRDYPTDADEDDKKAIAFLFGVISHDVADGLFHDDGRTTYLEYPTPVAQSGFLRMAKAIDGFSTDEGPELAADWRAAELALRDEDLEYTVYTPYDDVWMSYLYAYLYGSNAKVPTMGDLWADQVFLKGALEAWPLLVFAKKPADDKVPWTRANTGTYSPGGLVNQLEQIGVKWTTASSWLGTYEPLTTASVTPTEPDGNEGWYRQPVTVTLQVTDFARPKTASDEHYSLDGGSSYGQYGGPLRISTQGSSTVFYYAEDFLQNEETPKSLALKIDTQAPIVNVVLDQPRYVGTQPFVVRVSGKDPEPGSGMHSFIAEFNGQPVTDGQSVDLLLLAPGTYTLSVTAEDVAGWVTESSQRIDVYATIDSLIAASDRVCALGWISPAGVCTTLRAKLVAAKTALGRGYVNAARSYLMAFVTQLEAQKGKTVSLQAYDLLKADALYVWSSKLP